MLFWVKNISFLPSCPVLSADAQLGSVSVTFPTFSMKPCTSCMYTLFGIPFGVPLAQNLAETFWSFISTGNITEHCVGLPLLVMMYKRKTQNQNITAGIEWCGLKGNSGGPLLNLQLVEAAPVTAHCLGSCPVKFGVSPKKEILQLLWATYDSISQFLQWMRTLFFYWIGIFILYNQKEKSLVLAGSRRYTQFWQFSHL